MFKTTSKLLDGAHFIAHPGGIFRAIVKTAKLSIPKISGRVNGRGLVGLIQKRLIDAFHELSRSVKLSIPSKTTKSSHDLGLEFVINSATLAEKDMSLNPLVATLQCIRDSSMAAAMVIKTLSSKTISRWNVERGPLVNLMTNRLSEGGLSTLYPDADADLAASLIITLDIDAKDFLLTGDDGMREAIIKVFDRLEKVRTLEVSWLSIGFIQQFLALISLIYCPSQLSNLLGKGIDPNTPAGVTFRGEALERLAALCVGLIYGPFISYASLLVDQATKYGELVGILTETMAWRETKTVFDDSIVTYVNQLSTGYAQFIDSLLDEPTNISDLQGIISDMVPYEFMDILNQIKNPEDTATDMKQSKLKRHIGNLGIFPAAELPPEIQANLLMIPEVENPAWKNADKIYEASEDFAKRVRSLCIVLKARLLKYWNPQTPMIGSINFGSCIKCLKISYTRGITETSPPLIGSKSPVIGVLPENPLLPIIFDELGLLIATDHGIAARLPSLCREARRAYAHRLRTGEGNKNFSPPFDAIVGAYDYPVIVDQNALKDVNNGLLPESTWNTLIPVQLAQISGRRYYASDLEQNGDIFNVLFGVPLKNFSRMLHSNVTLKRSATLLSTFGILVFHKIHDESFGDLIDDFEVIEGDGYPYGVTYQELLKLTVLYTEGDDGNLTFNFQKFVEANIAEIDGFARGSATGCLRFMTFRRLPKVIEKVTYTILSDLFKFGINEGSFTETWPIPWFTDGSPLTNMALRPFNYFDMESPKHVFNKTFVQFNSRWVNFSSSGGALVNGPPNEVFSSRKWNGNITEPGLRETIVTGIISEATQGQPDELSVIDDITKLETKAAELHTEAEKSSIKEIRIKSKQNDPVTEAVAMQEASPLISGDSTKGSKRPQQNKRKKKRPDKKKMSSQSKPTKLAEEADDELIEDNE